MPLGNALILFVVVLSLVPNKSENSLKAIISTC